MRVAYHDSMMKKRILIVDDEPALPRLLERYLSRRGFGIITAMTGRDGIFRAVAEQPDVVLVDVDLPDLDGISVAAVLRRGPFTARIPVVVWSAYGTPSLVAAARDAGASDFIAKSDAAVGTLTHRIARAAALPPPAVFNSADEVEELRTRVRKPLQNARSLVSAHLKGTTPWNASS